MHNHHKYCIIITHYYPTHIIALLPVTNKWTPQTITFFDFFFIISSSLSLAACFLDSSTKYLNASLFITSMLLNI